MYKKVIKKIITVQKRYPLGSYIFKRLLFIIPLLFIVVVVNFLIIHFAPGDPAIILAGQGYTSEAYLASIRVAYGLDKTISEQFVIYLRKLLSLDLGRSLMWNAPVLTIILERLPATFFLMASAIFFSSILGIILGVLGAVREGSKVDYLITIISLVGYSIPIFWFAQLLLILFAIYLDWLPAAGMTSYRGYYSGWEYLSDLIRHAILPIFTLSLYYLALISRLTKASMLENIRKDFVTLARSKGLTERTVFFKHTLKNALLPVITVIGMNISYMFGGAVITEAVYSWPGMGSLFYTSMVQRDYPLLMGIFVLTCIFVAVINIITDIFYAYVDPRIRYK